MNSKDEVPVFKRAQDMNAAARRKPRAVARKLNAHHMKTLAGFYGSNEASGGGCRYFGARVRAGKLQVTPDFESWLTIEDLDEAAFHDHNGRPVFI